jgi:DNA repair protein RadD
MIADGFQLSPDLWAPQRRGVEKTIGLLSRGRDVCLYAPTGGGKTKMAAELIRWSSYSGVCSGFYTNRKLLVGQTYAKFAEMGLDVGVRAADYEDLDRPTAMVQICATDTERSRVYRRGEWALHPAGLVIIDEIHMNKSRTIEQIIRDYRDSGANVVVLTATPLGVSHLVDDLVVSGTMGEYRECGALVMAAVYSITQPDLSKIKRNLTGEFIMDGEKKRIFTQSIIGDIYDVAWMKHNPDGRPAFLYAPCKASSAFTAKYMSDKGVRWAHIDCGEVWLDYKRYSRSRGVWDDLLGQFIDGSVKGISCRFVLREGVDVPSAYQSILACPIGSMSSYVQICGRVLRKSEQTPDEVVISDLGGNYWRHGSPNATRPWHDWFRMTEEQVSSQVERERRENGGPEPIRCPQCGLERTGGIKCPKCGFQHPKSVRYIKMLDGEVKRVEGNLIHKIRTSRRSDTEKKWTDLFWAWRRSKKTQDKSLAQLEGFFTHVEGYHPPRDLPFMPKSNRDWHQHVSKVDFDLLVPGR